MRILPDVRLLIVFIITSFLPSLTFVALKAGSLAVGLSIACTINIVVLGDVAFKTRRLKRSVLTILIAALCLLFISSTASAIQYGDFKPLQSVLMFSLIIVSAYLLSEYLDVVAPEAVVSTIWVFCIILLAIGWAKNIYVPGFLNYNMHLKATFPFSEESHYALVAGFFFCAYSFFGNWRKVLFLILNSAVLAAIYPSLSMLVYAGLNLLILFMRLPRKTFVVSIFSIVPASAFGFYLLSSRVEYFSSRLDFGNLENLTALVFAQGWQLAYLNFVETTGLGLGFQMLGSDNTVVGPLTYRIMDVASYGRALNLSDGGFLAAKLIAEFGVLGLIFSILYMFYFLIIPFKANRIITTKSQLVYFGRSVRYATVFSLAPEFFLRGYGYFSPSLYFVLVATMVIPVIYFESTNFRSEVDYG